MTNFSDKYNKAIQLIDEAYKGDKDKVKLDGEIYPKEYLYALRMVKELKAFNSEASEEVYLAARCQHLFRWEIPRNSYPMDRKGYHAWRTFLYTYQAKKSAEILNKIGYSQESQLQISSMIEKKNLQSDSNSQLLEDVVCLVFLKYYINDFIEQHKENTDKLKRIILSTWLKMSDKGHEAALGINFEESVKKLILEAVS
ncbi:DUF4202 domain-containing protein [Saccharicrinis aurantiacus]|uniref:DUF4202 domain-containing protein n=1 Tax=Saccharicrinis aurantiacus TaxID=1849719 RepID=UPI0008388DB6|nr:DUF4202 domain-containing protein [Saccharicrinis aurantiacus]